MATGRLGTADLAATTLTTLYTVPVSKVGSFTLSLTNRTAAPVAVRAALAATATPAVSEYIEYDAIVPANGVLERTGLVLDATKLLVVYAGAAGVSANAYGFEE